MDNRRSSDFDALSEAQIAVGRLATRRVVDSTPSQLAQPQSMAGLPDSIQHVSEAAIGERSFLHLDRSKDLVVKQKRCA